MADQVRLFFSCDDETEQALKDHPAFQNCAPLQAPEGVWPSIGDLVKLPYSPAHVFRAIDRRMEFMSDGSVDIYVYLGLVSQPRPKLSPVR